MAVMVLEKPTGTRERILAEAAELFAARGYGATSTRDIAEAVGIRQPSLFHHFASKAAILTELLDRSLDDAVPLARRSAQGDGPVGQRLFDYLVADFAMVLTSPWNLSGVYSDEVLRDPEFATQAAQIEQLDAAIRAMIEQGVASGEFVAVDAELTPGDDRRARDRADPQPAPDSLSRSRSGPAARRRRSSCAACWSTDRRPASATARPRTSLGQAEERGRSPSSPGPAPRRVAVVDLVAARTQSSASSVRSTSNRSPCSSAQSSSSPVTRSSSSKRPWCVTVTYRPPRQDGVLDRLVVDAREVDRDAGVDRPARRRARSRRSAGTAPPPARRRARPGARSARGSGRRSPGWSHRDLAADRGVRLALSHDDARLERLGRLVAAGAGGSVGHVSAGADASGRPAAWRSGATVARSAVASMVSGRRARARRRPAPPAMVAMVGEHGGLAGDGRRWPAGDAPPARQHRAGSRRC